MASPTQPAANPGIATWRRDLRRVGRPRLSQGREYAVIKPDPIELAKLSLQLAETFRKVEKAVNAAAARRTSATTSTLPTLPNGTSRGSAFMTSLSLRESVLEFMTSNPTAWRIKALAAKLGVGAQRMGLELSRLNAEGKLVSCTVKAPAGGPRRSTASPRPSRSWIRTTSSSAGKPTCACAAPAERVCPHPRRYPRGGSDR